MSVNENIRCIEWFDASIISPSNPDDRFVLGWYEDGHIRRVRVLNCEWTLANYGPGELRHEFAKPTHWCEFPEGPGNPLQSPQYLADVKALEDFVGSHANPESKP